MLYHTFQIGDLVERIDWAYGSMNIGDRAYVIGFSYNNLRLSPKPPPVGEDDMYIHLYTAIHFNLIKRRCKVGTATDNKFNTFYKNRVANVAA